MELLLALFLLLRLLGGEANSWMELYLFDYGDEWHFRVELEEIRREGRKLREPKNIEKKGKAPK